MTYTQAQIDKANAVDLEKFLRAQGETLVHSGKEYRWKAHDSLTVCGNKWFRHSQSKGGFPVDFVMEFYGKSFPEAVQMLTGEPGEAQPEADPAPSPAFRLPLRNVTNANILNYLTQERKLSPSLVNFFIAAGDIYEDAAHHNVVFVGRDADGHPRYASSRGIREKFRQDAAGAEKAFGFAHRGTDKQLLVFEAPIDLLSFIELFPKNWQQHNYLSLGGVSGKALRQFLSERPDVERVFLSLDADKAGEDACKRLAALLPDTVSVTRIQPCMKDWNDVLVHRAEIPNRNYFKSIVLKEPSKPETVKIIRMSDVELTPVDWLWKPYLPFGKLSVLQGNPGEGKTYFAMHLAAACTNGKLLPNMERMEPFNVIYQTAEDGLGDTVKPRLIEAGADLDRVLVIDDSDVQLTLSDERIEKAIIENNARLVIIDPIQAYLGADVDMNRANEVRPIFMRLGQVAQRTGCAILLIGHLNKAAGMQSLQRGLGSIDIAAAVRSVMFIGKLKHDPTMRILTHEKSSLAPPGASLAFSLGDEGGFRWVGEYDITADEMLSGIEPQRETKTQQAKDLICALLAGIVLWAILQLIVGGAVQLGYARFNLNLVDRKDAAVSDLFSQKDRLWDGFCMKFLQGLYIALWSLLLVIPGIVKSYSYAMTPYIMSEHPSLTANEAITESRRIMDGNKWRLFCLDFSFIGWELLCSLPLYAGGFLVLKYFTGSEAMALSLVLLLTIPLSIGFFFVRPYEEAAWATFYRDITAAPTEPDEAS